MNREELHALVWSKPMRTAAKERGISDVALAKQCRKASVPVPPRGYWNKVQAGKQVSSLPLPPLSIAVGAKLLSGLFPGFKDGFVQNRDDPQPPEFDDIERVRRRITLAVGDIRVPSRLVNPHQIVARLLRLDEERRAKVSLDSFSYNYYGPKFDKPIQQRRLRILSAAIVALENLGLKMHGSTHAGERFSIEIRKGVWVYILLAVENGPHGDSFYRDRGRNRRPPGERIRFDITGHSPDYEPPSQTWRDNDVPLESQLGEILCGILLKIEEDTRRWATSSYERAIQERARNAKEARVSAERAQAERAACIEAAAKARLLTLFAEADAFEGAARIRRYVAAARQHAAARSDTTDLGLLEQWGTWALTEADVLDPIISGRFATDLRAHKCTNDCSNSP